MIVPRIVSRSILIGVVFGASVAGALAVVKPVPAVWCVADDHSGTATLPAPCRWASTTQEVIRISGGGIPQIQSTFRLDSFFDVTGAPGGTLGGEVQQFKGSLTLYMQGTGGLSSFRRTITIPVVMETDSAPRTPGALVQSFNHEMRSLQGQITGDPDFDLLRITAGGAFGMPSPGHTTLTRLSDGRWVVDSSFQIAYRMQFTGAPGGHLPGQQGTNPIAFVVNAHTSAFDLVTAQPNALGSANIPGGSGPVRSDPGQRMDLVDGFPAGSPLHMVPSMSNFSIITTTPGPLGGPSYRQNCAVSLVTTGEGSNSGYTRTFVLPHILELATTPGDPNDPNSVESLDTQVTFMQGQITGDPDFDLLRITGGTSIGLPSSGHTQLYKIPNGTWAVDSHFDIPYHLEYVGHPGGPFGGMSGSTTGTIRMAQGAPLPRRLVAAHGLLHAPFGAAQMTVVGDGNDPSFSDPNSPAILTGLTASGHDGVGLDDPNTPGGWYARIDFGQGGSLDPNQVLMMVVGDPNQPYQFAKIVNDPNEMVSISDPNEWPAAITIRSSQIGSATVTATVTPTAGAPPQPLHAQLRLGGALVDAMDYMPPLPPFMVTGPIGSHNGQGVDFDLRNGCPNGLCSDGLRARVRNPVPVVMQMTGSTRGPVLADTIELNMLPPGTPWTAWRLLGQNMPSLTFQSGGLVQQNKRWGAGGGNQLSPLTISGSGGPPTPAVHVSEIGGLRLYDLKLEADTDGDGVPEPIQSVGIRFDMGQDHHLEPDARIAWDMDGENPPGSATPFSTNLSLSHVGNSPPQVGLEMVGFTAHNVTLTATLGGGIVDARTLPGPPPPVLATMDLVSNNVAGALVSADYSGATGSCQCIVLHLHSAAPTTVQLTGSSSVVIADDLKIEMTTAGLPAGSPIQSRVMALQALTKNQWELDILDSTEILLEADLDGDGVFESHDCDDNDPHAWNSPGEARDAHFLSDKVTLVWSTPFDEGGEDAHTLYDTLRTTVPYGWSGATCIDAHSPDHQSLDNLKPPPSTAFFYLVRADNACPGTGTLGTGSGGTPRIAPPCP